MREFVTVFVIACAAVMVAACGAQGESGKAQAGPVGVWQRSITGAVGKPYREILELLENGTYVKHAGGWAADRGRYAAEAGVMKFTSEVDQRHTRNVAFTLTGGKLTFKLTVPLPSQEEWTRFNQAPNFRTIDIDGRRVPRNLTGMLAVALVSEARPWRKDAVPTWIRVQQGGNGQYEASLHFYSPSTVEEMRIRVSAYDYQKSTNDGSRTATAPLSPEVLDLPQVLALAKQSGLKGALERADIRVYNRYGAVWMLTTNARQGVTVSGETGAIIREDVTGYIAQYNAEWARIVALWQPILARFMPQPVSLFSGSTPSSSSDSGSSGSSGPTYDTGSQNSWSQGDWGAYHRFQTGTPTGNDCNRYGGC